MTREEAIQNISIAMGEPKDVVKRMANALEALGSMPIVNLPNFNIPIEKPTRKSYVSPYAEFDKIRRKRK